jgi:uroporphyrinogen decarboxylase
MDGMPEEVTEAARRCIEVGAPGGRFILSPGCELPRDTPAENLVALVEAARTFGRYPLTFSGV